MLVSKIENGRRTAEEITIGTIAAAVYYVDIATGSDSNNGLSTGAAFKTIQHALDLFSNKIIIGDGAKIRICAGDYSSEGRLTLTNCTGDLVITAFNGSNDISAVNTTYKIDSILIKNSNFIRLLSLNATSTTNSAIYYYYSKGSFDYCSSTSSASGQTGASIYCSFINASLNTFSNKAIAIEATVSSTVYSSTQNAGSGNTIGLASYTASTIGKFGTQPQGTTAESTASGGAIR